MIYAFDLDGTLVDSRDANLAAYRMIGVEPPEDFNVRPWGEWTTKAIHDAKNIMFEQFAADHIHALPLMELARECGGHVLSMCSRPCMAMIRRLVDFGPNIDNVVHSMSIMDKVDYLSDLGTGIYWDDSAKACEIISRHLRGWQICHVQR